MKNFYEHQEVARSNSAGMMLLLSLAMFLTTLATGFVLTVSTFGPWYYCVHLHYRETIASMIPVLGQLELVGPNHGAEIHETFPWMLAGFWFGVLTLATGTGIILVTRAKMTRLRRRGGIGVAESLGAICISDGKHQQDLDCRKTVNIVEEMAIAAGIRPPTVYLLLGEPGINAFALGFQPEDTVIGLTDGAVKTLNREQLQGVVAHEFSHIANGDIKTNLRLIGYLHGILAVILMSQHLIRGGVELFVKSATYGASGAWALLLVVMGILLWPVGLSGLLCAAVVKAAFSREREHLADAKAVQFARNPQALADAMKRVIGHPQGTHLKSAHGLSLSHVFFGKGCGGFFGRLDSHPPMAERILRVDPNWDGFPIFEAEHEVAEMDGVFQGTMANDQADTPDEDPVEDFQLDDAITMDVNRHSAFIRDGLAPGLFELTQSSDSAQAMLQTLWALGQYGSQPLRPAGHDSQFAKVIEAMLEHLSNLELAERLMLFDTILDVLPDEMLAACQVVFDQNADSESDLFRWMCRKVVDTKLHSEKPPTKFGSISDVAGPCEIVLSALAHAHDSGPMAELALGRAAADLNQDFVLRSRDECRFEVLDAALEVLSQLAPKARRKFMMACSTSAASDAELTDEEALLIRGICSGLGYRPTSIMPGQPVVPNQRW